MKPKEIKLSKTNLKNFQSIQVLNQIFSIARPVNFSLTFVEKKETKAEIRKNAV